MQKHGHASCGCWRPRPSRGCVCSAGAFHRAPSVYAHLGLTGSSAPPRYSVADDRISRRSKLAHGPFQHEFNRNPLSFLRPGMSDVWLVRLLVHTGQQNRSSNTAHALWHGSQRRQRIVLPGERGVGTSIRRCAHSRLSQHVAPTAAPAPKAQAALLDRRGLWLFFSFLVAAICGAKAKRSCRS